MRKYDIPEEVNLMHELTLARELNARLTKALRDLYDAPNLSGFLVPKQRHVLDEARIEALKILLELNA